MLFKSHQKFAVLFLLLLILELVCGSVKELALYRYFTKPSLLIILIVFFSLQTKTEKGFLRSITLGALMFSLLGDILLMFVDVSAHYFTAGLASFLLAHVCYIFAFKSDRNSTKTVWPFVIILVLYAGVLFYVVYDGLGAMLIPVLIYMITILTMALMAYYRKGIVGAISFNMVFFGALLFMISDSLIAIDKFYKPLTLSHLAIMSTYGLAQLLIVLGLLQKIKTKKAVTT